MDRSLCTASLVSQTYAQKAQRALAQAAIPCRVVKLDSEKSSHGCTHGIEFACAQLSNVTHILTAAHIRIRHLYAGDTEV